MAKYNYFKALESLSECAYNATLAACSEKSMNSKKTISEIRSMADDILLSLENALFTDFLPPLERDDIAAYAHSLSRVIDTAAEHKALRATDKITRKKTAEEAVCLKIAEKIKESTTILKKLRGQSDIPDIQNFRQLLRSGFDSHSTELSKLSLGGNSAAHAQTLLSTARLRRELSLCFDSLLETMLNNI